MYAQRGIGDGILCLKARAIMFCLALKDFGQFIGLGELDGDGFAFDVVAGRELHNVACLYGFRVYVSFFGVSQVKPPTLIAA